MNLQAWEKELGGANGGSSLFRHQALVSCLCICLDGNDSLPAKSISHCISRALSCAVPFFLISFSSGIFLAIFSLSIVNRSKANFRAMARSKR